MWNLSGILVTAAIIVLIEIPTLRKIKKMKKEFWTFCILTVLATGFSIAYGLGVSFPNPVDLVTIIYKPISNFIYGALR